MQAKLAQLQLDGKTKQYEIDHAKAFKKSRI